MRTVAGKLWRHQFRHSKGMFVVPCGRSRTRASLGGSTRTGSGLPAPSNSTSSGRPRSEHALRLRFRSWNAPLTAPPPFTVSVKTPSWPARQAFPDFGKTTSLSADDEQPAATIASTSGASLRM